MCTVIVWFQQWKETPIVVAANRDEAKDRQASVPFVWEHDAFVAPRDEKAGGTWFGISKAGHFVAVTNRFPSEKHENRASRGTLVVEALRATSVSELHEQLGSLSADRFNAFHLIYGDNTSLGLTWNDGAQISQRWLEPGLHIVTERSLGGDDAARTALIQEVVHQKVGTQLPSAETIREILSTRREETPAANICVDLPQFNYGTRSSIAFFGARSVPESKFYWIEKPPTQGPFEDRSSLLVALTGSSRC